MSARWEGDEHGRGVANAEAFVHGASELLEAMQAADWVAEQPEVHLLPHLREACASLPLDIVDARTAADGVFEVELRWRGEGAGIGEIRATVFALVGSIAEVATYVRQREGRVFELATGILSRDSHFAPHGHTVRFSVGED